MDSFPKNRLLAVLVSLAMAAVVAAQAPKTSLIKPQASAAAPSADKGASKVDPEYIIGPGDVLSIDVYQEPEVSRTLPVRPDGRISLPLAGEILAQGKTALQLQAEVTERLKKFIDHPSVTVMVQDAQSQRYNILGMVMKPGTYPLAHPATILDAIALAGGLRDFAHGNKIYLLRKRASDGVEIRYNFNYRQVSLGVHPEQNIALLPGDIIVVP